MSMRREPRPDDGRPTTSRRLASACACWIARRRLCLGCFRTLDEIAAWSVLDADAKRGVLAALPARASGASTPMIADWYFDFVSPFAYLQSEQLASLAPRVSVRYRPVLFAGLLGANGQKGPAEIPAKRAFTYRFCIWQAKAARHPAPVPARASVQSAAAAAPRDRLRCDARRRAPDLPLRLARRPAARSADRMGGARRATLGVPDADARIATAEVKDELRRNTDEAIARGVFGVPTLAIGDELFWGADATAMAADYVAAGCRFADPEYARVAALPVGAGAARRRRRSRVRKVLTHAGARRSASIAASS